MANLPTEQMGCARQGPMFFYNHSPAQLPGSAPPGVMVIQPSPPPPKTWCWSHEIPLLTQPASKLRVTHRTQTWIYTLDITSWDHQPAHVGEEQETGNKCWNRWFCWNVRRTLFPWRHCPKGLCSLCPWKLNVHRTKPRVTWCDPAADPPWSSRLEFRLRRSLPAWVVLWSPETRRGPKNAHFLGQAIFVTRNHQWIAYWTASVDESILIKIRRNTFGFCLCFRSFVCLL